MIKKLMNSGFTGREVMLMFTSFSMSDIISETNEVNDNVYVSVIKNYSCFDINVQTKAVTCVEECKIFRGNIMSNKVPLVFYRKTIVVNSFEDFFLNKKINFDKRQLDKKIVSGEYEDIKKYYQNKLEEIGVVVKN